MSDVDKLDRMLAAMETMTTSMAAARASYDLGIDEVRTITVSKLTEYGEAMTNLFAHIQALDQRVSELEGQVTVLLASEVRLLHGEKTSVN